MSKCRKVIAVIKGGLGNQLFCYAAARRLSIANDAELAIDHLSGFKNDYQYRRQYALDNFDIQARKARARERLEPLANIRRRALRLRCRHLPYSRRRYIEQKGMEFDARLLNLRFNSTRYLDGYWQSEDYFADIEPVLRQDLKINPPIDSTNVAISNEIKDTNAVGIHVRWFRAAQENDRADSNAKYYERALAFMEESVDSPHYFIFSDRPEDAISMLRIPHVRATVVKHNQSDSAAFADLWLMTQCKHMITANSTFSWWGAWLGKNEKKIVVTPDIVVEGVGAWGFSGLIPERWVRL